MTSPTRLGDLIRVIDALQPDADQLALIAELLPDERGTEHRHIPMPRQSAGIPHGLASTATGPTHITPPTRRRAWRRQARERRPFRRETAPRNVAWWTTTAVLVTLLLVLRATNQLEAGVWLGASAALLLGRPLWLYAWHSWSAWWRSAQRHSSAAYEDLQDHTRDEKLAAAGMALTRARWQPPPPSAPLVLRSQRRAVATLLAGRPAPGEIDLVTILREVASRRPLTVIPRRLRWSSNQGMQLHFDTGMALEPFRHDIQQLRGALATIASPHTVVERGFDGDPRVIAWPRRIVGHSGRLPLAARLPSPGTPVLVVTDLGIAVPRAGSPPEPDDFLDHYRLLRQAGCTVHYLVPYPPERWPSMLEQLPVLYWSDDLDAAAVLAGMRRRTRAA